MIISASQPSQDFISILSGLPPIFIRCLPTVKRLWYRGFNFVNSTWKGYLFICTISGCLPAYFYQRRALIRIECVSMENQPLKRKKPTDSPTKDAICVSCKKNAAKNAIECDRCSKWEHKNCARVSDDIYGLLNNVPENIKFFCTSCCAIISTISEVNVKFDYLEGKFCKSWRTSKFDYQTKLKH